MPTRPPLFCVKNKCTSLFSGQFGIKGCCSRYLGEGFSGFRGFSARNITPQYVLEMKVQANAMIIHETVHIRAPMEIVWDVFSRVENWSEWNPVCRQCRFEAGDRLAAGTCLSFELKPLFFPIRIAPEVKDCEKGSLVTWAGAKWGVHARHSFRFEPLGDQVRIDSIEKFFGPMLFAAKLVGIPGRLHKLTRHLLAAIKTTAESRIN